MANFGDLTVRLGLDTTNFKAGLGDVKTSLVGWRDETNKSTTEIAKWGAAIGLTLAPLIAVGAELASLTIQAATFGKMITDNARELGLSTEQYQRWTHAAIAAGSGAEEITGAIRMLSVRLKDTVDPTSEVSRYLTAMGVSATDASGKVRPMNDILMDLIPALNALPEGMDRNQASMVMFGRGFSSIIDLTSLTREQLAKLMNEAPTFSDDKIKNMDDMSIKMALLNEQIKVMSVDLGADLIPVANDLLGVFEQLSPVVKFITDLLHDGATGATMMTQGLQLLATQWQYGMDSPQMTALQASVQEYAQSKYNERTGYVDMTSAGYMDAAARNAKGLNVAPAKSADTAVLSASDIRDKQLELRELTNITIPDLTNKLKEARLTGLKKDIEDASIALEKATNKASDLAIKVGVASGSAMTYNKMFASSLQDGGVGSDWAGESELANMTSSQLAEIAKGGAGKSKSMAEKAQSYLDRMKMSGGGTETSSSTKVIEPGSPEQTKIIQTELQKQSDALSEYLDKSVSERKTKYAVMEKMDLTHWATFAEMARTSEQKVMEYCAESVNFAGSNPIKQNMIVMSKNGPDWIPPAFTAIKAPTLDTVDFTKVGASVGEIVSKGIGNGSGGTKGDVKVDVVVNVDKNGGATATATVNKGLAGAGYLGGVSN